MWLRTSMWWLKPIIMTRLVELAYSVGGASIQKEGFITTCQKLKAMVTGLPLRQVHSRNFYATPNSLCFIPCQSMVFKSTHKQLI